jgi:hypothetical protein
VKLARHRPVIIRSNAHSTRKNGAELPNELDAVPECGWNYCAWETDSKTSLVECNEWKACLLEQEPASEADPADFARETCGYSLARLKAWAITGRTLIPPAHEPD